jgi:hypothetical protein
MNADLSEYLVPVNANVGDIDVLLVDERDDHVDPIGVKGIGEIGTTGVAAAVANAVYHATGVRHCGCVVYVSCHPDTGFAHTRVIESRGPRCSVRQHEVGVRLFVSDLLAQRSSSRDEGFSVTPPRRPAAQTA